MKVYISYPIRDTPFGGGNQFIKALAGILRTRGYLTNDIISADVVLTNGFYFPPILHTYDDLFNFKRKYPQKKIIHRVDGVFNQVRGHDFLYMDDIVSEWAMLNIDGAIFQSEYCRSIQYKNGYPTDIISATIGNACDPNMFYPGPFKTTKNTSNRIQLIYTSWSDNPRKGFSTLKMLDEMLDFERYSLTFIGNSPITFKNVRHIPPLESTELASHLRNADIFVGFSHNEPCSNAICEALACGLPVLIRNTGGNPSFVPQGAVLYDRDEDILEMLNRISSDLVLYRSRINPLNLNTISEQYIDFAEYVVKQRPPFRPDIRKFLAFRKKLRKYYPQLPERRAWRGKLWLESLWN